MGPKNSSGLKKEVQHFNSYLLCLTDRTHPVEWHPVVSAVADRTTLKLIPDEIDELGEGGNDVIPLVLPHFRYLSVFILKRKTGRSNRLNHVAHPTKK